MEIVYYCKNIHLLRHRCEYICTCVIYDHMDLETKVRHYKASHTINMKPKSIIQDAGDLILLFNITKPLTLVFAL